ncbi:TetR/AcrR family transcriptional regulator [Corynebacterium alimapuense]|uniref:TetR/AcrR family transcriptional regulator n=1 Tax=Corynebacterium alimapuense TaxID=1576874 RepID=A0A3M8K7W9_9CORY|nr:TetR/AcrR family transcriptional regulator [Corynebacterium alimapuense]RNE48614.1 TetR/AcrR family transcriptional regulator [Corynebacterium alimapuense]
MAGAVGRPRKNSPRRSGSTAREEILDASAELFTTKGFATTSTHQIADAVGIRQASLYYHFPSKTEIFLTLLTSTIAPSTKLAAALGDSEVSPALRLWSLVAAETRLLLSTRWNVGRLYQLPIASSEEFSIYHSQRTELKDIFQSLTAAIVGADDPRLDLPFHLALSVIEMRQNNGTVPSPLKDDELPAIAVMLADAALDVLHAPLPEDRITRTLDLIRIANAENQ